jgi:hypothetical protein
VRDGKAGHDTSLARNDKKHSGFGLCRHLNQKRSNLIGVSLGLPFSGHGDARQVIRRLAAEVKRRARHRFF